MPLVAIRLKPGVNTQATPALLEWGISSYQLIRFRDEVLQEIGGWAKSVQTAFTAVCRGLHSWTQLDGYSISASGRI